MSKPKLGLTVHQVCSYNKVVLGFTMRTGVSLYTTACRSLKTDGLLRPDGVNERAWVQANRAHILSRITIKPKEKRATRPSPVAITGYRGDVTSNEFLESYQWRALRMVVLKKYGATCQCCGASPSAGAVMNVDHIKPRRLFPHLALDEDNLQVLCHECNHGKGNWDQTDWRQDADLPSGDDLNRFPNQIHDGLARPESK